MATPNYGYEKRQKELAKKRKKEDKLKSKSERKGPGEDDTAVDANQVPSEHAAGQPLPGADSPSI